jgi:hypothetical protein
MSDALREYVSSRGLSHGVQAQDPQQRREQLRLARDAGTAAKILQGFWLAQIREIEGHEAFLAAAAELRIGRTAAYDAAATLALFNRLPDLSSVAALGQLEPSKALMLKAWSDEDLLRFARGESVKGIALDAAVELPVAALQAQQRTWQVEHEDQLRTLRKERLDAEMEAEKLRAENLRLLNRRTYAANERDMPLFARAAREESGVLTEQMSLAVEALRAAADEHVFRDVQHPEVHVYQPEAAATMYFALAGVVGRAVQLLRRLEERFPDAVAGGVRVEHQFTPAELEMIAEQRAAIFGAQKVAVERRDKQRHNSTPGKRGAKRK